MELLITHRNCGKLGFYTLHEGRTLHNRKLYNKAPQSQNPSNSSEPKPMLYKWDYPTKMDFTISNRSRIYKLAQEQKAIQTMQIMDEAQPYLNLEQRQHLRRVHYINQKELDYRRKLDRK